MTEPEARDNGKGSYAPRRVVLLGMRCTFTRPILTALREADNVDLTAIVLPGNNASSPSTLSDPLLDGVEGKRTPVIEVPDRPGLTAPQFRTAMECIAPDIVIVACFPWRLPQWLLSLPTKGCLNVHPSLLPDGRGPEPVFWAFRRGLTETGVTLHLMDEDFDTGPVVSQRRHSIPGDATIPDLEQSLAEMGARMVTDHISMASGRPVIASPQPEGTGRYAPTPRQEDLVVPTSWSARHAARFFRAVVPVYGPIPVLVLATGQRLMVDRVIQLDAHHSTAEPVVMDGETARIRFADGSLTCRIVRDRQVLQIHRTGDRY